MIYLLPSCGQVDTKPEVLNFKNIILSYDKCVNVTPFSSFQGGVTDHCPDGKIPVVLAFFENNCGGSPVSADKLPADGSPGTCLEVLVGPDLKTPEAGGKSVFFTCVDKVPV